MLRVVQGDCVSESWAGGAAGWSGMFWSVKSETTAVTTAPLHCSPPAGAASAHIYSPA